MAVVNEDSLILLVLFVIVRARSIQVASSSTPRSYRRYTCVNFGLCWGEFVCR